MWGQVPIEDKSVIDKFADHIQQYKPLTIDNALFNDFDPRKGFKKSRIAAEHGVMPFDWDITSVRYGRGKFEDTTSFEYSLANGLKWENVKGSDTQYHNTGHFNEHPEVLAKLLYYMDTCKDFQITNELMSGDPKENKVKNLEIQYKNVRWGGDDHMSKDTVFSQSHKKYEIVDREGTIVCFNGRLGFFDKAAKDLMDPWFWAGKAGNKASMLGVGGWLTESFRQSWATRV